MTTAPIIDTVDGAEAAWLDALTAPSTQPLDRLLHPDFVAIHSAIGRIQTRADFLADIAGRPATTEVRLLDSITRLHGDVAIVSSIQQSAIGFVPDVPGFAIQAAVTRVWTRVDGNWLLAHLQMARRLPPG